jgi:ABC-type glycerol-3-phosphate transport system permease component
MFAQWLLSTAMVGVLVVEITPFLAIPAGYGLARLTGRSAPIAILDNFFLDRFISGFTVGAIK